MSFLINKNSGGHLQPMSDINVTPFVDVMLVLLVIFMVTAPMMVTGLVVNLPRASARIIENAEDKLVLSIKSDRKIYLGDAEVSLQRLAEVLKSNGKLKTNKEIPWVGGLHPATKVFQALRIAVNDELGVVERVIPQAMQVLTPGGRLAIIAFHSLEDRIVKHMFKDLEVKKIGAIITKKPIECSPEEAAANTRARSAKLRLIQKN